MLMVMASIDRVYISHFPPLVERRNWLEKALGLLGWEAEWVTHFDKRTLSAETISRFYSSDRGEFARRAELGGAFGVPLAPRVLSMGEVANAITHVHIFEQIVKNDFDACLILEDDVVFGPDFREELEQRLDRLPPDWDVLYPGSGCGLHIPAFPPDLKVYPHPKRESRTADCYVLRGKAAKKILSTIVPFVLPIDWELNFHQWKHELNVYWGEPSIAYQGSETGVYSSSAGVQRA